MAAQATTDTTSQLLGTVKNTFADKLKDARVTSAVVQEIWPVSKKEVIGNGFLIPIMTQHSQSTTYGQDESSGALTAMTAPQSTNLTIPAREVTERFLITFGALAKAEKGSDVSFVTEQTLKALSIWTAAKRQVEQGLLYGGMGFATIASAGSVTGSGNTALVTLTLTAGSWSIAYLAGCKNAPVDVYQSNGTSKVTTTIGATVTAVDPILGTVTIQGNVTDLGNIAATHQLWRYGENGNSITGIVTQLLNTASVLFTGADPTVNAIFKGNVFATTGNLSIGILMKRVGQAKSLGLEGKAIVMVPPDGFSALANELAGLRRLDGTYSKGKLDTGAETIDVRVGNVVMSITEVPFLQEGHVVCVSEDDVMRPALQDLDDKVGSHEMTVMSSTQNGFEMRVFTSQNAIVTAPSRGFVMTGVTFP